MGSEISVGHAEGIAEVGEGQIGGAGEHGHDGQPTFLVNDPIELEKRFRVHVSLVRGSVK